MKIMNVQISFDFIPDSQKVTLIKNDVLFNYFNFFSLNYHPFPSDSPTEHYILFRFF